MQQIWQISVLSSLQPILHNNLEQHFFFFLNINKTVDIIGSFTCNNILIVN